MFNSYRLETKFTAFTQYELDLIAKALRCQRQQLLNEAAKIRRLYWEDDREQPAMLSDIGDDLQGVDEILETLDDSPF